MAATSVTASLAVSKGSTDLTLSGLIHTQDATAKAVRVQTSPADL